LLVPAAACGPSSEEKAVRAAFQNFLEGLDRADPNQLWALADDETHVFFDELARETREGIADIDAHWPEAARPAARRAIAGDFVGANTTGATLFGHFLDPRRLQAPQDPSARNIVRVEMSGAKATLVLESGETLELMSDAAGAWRTAIFLAPAKELPWVGTLRENLATVHANATILGGADNDAAHKKEGANTP
jgi:hypothetical protein